MTLTVDLPGDLERRLRERASRQGRAIEEYVVALIERDALAPELVRAMEPSIPQPVQAPALSDDEFDQLLDTLTSGPALPHLPADFSRADITTGTTDGCPRRFGHPAAATGTGRPSARSRPRCGPRAQETRRYPRHVRSEPGRILERLHAAGRDR
jgi:hypothetical protein